MTEHHSHPQVSEHYKNYLKHLLDGNRQSCLDIVTQLMDQGVPLKSIYIDLFERSMYQVGELWETNAISVAVEHIATAITENAMGLLHPLIFASEHSGRKAIVTCVANEYHQIGGKMVADIFEFYGWDGYFLGANTPIVDLLRLVGEKKPDVVCFSLTLFANYSDLLGHIQMLHEACPDVRIIAGGQAFRWGGYDLEATLPQVRLITSLDDLEEFVTNFS